MLVVSWAQVPDGERGLLSRSDRVGPARLREAALPLTLPGHAPGTWSPGQAPQCPHSPCRLQATRGAFPSQERRRGLTGNRKVKMTTIWALGPQSGSLAPCVGMGAGARLARRLRRPVSCVRTVPCCLGKILAWQSNQESSVYFMGCGLHCTRPGARALGFFSVRGLS